MKLLTRTVSHADACANSPKFCCNCCLLSCRVSDRNCRCCLCQCVPVCVCKAAQKIILLTRSKPATSFIRAGFEADSKINDEVLECKWNERGIAYVHLFYHISICNYREYDTLTQQSRTFRTRAESERYSKNQLRLWCWCGRIRLNNSVSPSDTNIGLTFLHIPREEAVSLLSLEMIS